MGYNVPGYGKDWEKRFGEWTIKKKDTNNKIKTNETY